MLVDVTKREFKHIWELLEGERVVHVIHSHDWDGEFDLLVCESGYGLRVPVYPSPRLPSVYQPSGVQTLMEFRLRDLQSQHRTLENEIALAEKIVTTVKG